VAALQCAVNHYHKGMKRFMKKFLTSDGAPVVSDNQLSVIFGCVDQVLEANQPLLDSLQERVEGWVEGETTIGDVFVRFADSFRIYSEYVKHYGTSNEALSDARENPEFDKLCSEFATRAKGKLDLVSLLIMPVQRVPRYLLLLRELQKCTPDEHPDTPHLKEAAQAIGDLATYINEKQREFEAIVRVQAIATTTRNLPRRLAQPHRQLLSEAEADETQTYGKHVRVLLCNDILVLVKPVRKMRMTMRPTQSVRNVLPGAGSRFSTIDGSAASLGGADGGVGGPGGADRPGGPSSDQPTTHFEPPDPDYEFLGAFDLSDLVVSDPAVAASLASSDDGGSHKESGTGRSAMSIVLSGPSTYDSPAKASARCRLQWQSVALKETWLKSLRDAVVTAQAQAFPAMEAPYRPEAADALKVSAPAGVKHRSAADILAELGADPALLKSTLGAASGSKLDAAAIANLGDALTPRAPADNDTFAALAKGDSGRSSSPSGSRRGLNLSALKQKHRARSGTEDMLDISPLSPPSSPRSERREPLARVASFGSGIRRAVSNKKKGSKVELTLSQPSGFQHVGGGTPSSVPSSGVSDDEGGTHISDEPSIGSASVRSVESLDN